MPVRFGQYIAGARKDVGFLDTDVIAVVARELRRSLEQACAVTGRDRLGNGVCEFSG